MDEGNRRQLRPGQAQLGLRSQREIEEAEEEKMRASKKSDKNRIFLINKKIVKVPKNLYIYNKKRKIFCFNSNYIKRG